MSKLQTTAGKWVMKITKIVVCTSGVAHVRHEVAHTMEMNRKVEVWSLSNSSGFPTWKSTEEAWALHSWSGCPAQPTAESTCTLASSPLAEVYWVGMRPPRLVSLYLPADCGSSPLANVHACTLLSWTGWPAQLSVKRSISVHAWWHWKPWLCLWIILACRPLDI